MGVIVDRCAPKSIFDELLKLNIDYIKSFDLKNLYHPVNTHPDMQIHFVCDKTAVVAPEAYDYYKEVLPKEINLIKGKKSPESKYPFDIGYNVARVGKKIIGKLDFVDPVIKDIYQSQGYELINVNQGYAKCSLSVVDENSVITEDEGLFKVLSPKMDVLKVRAGYVSLTGFKNGFLGGASGFVAKNKLAFSGNIEFHPDFFEIKNFVKERNIDIIKLSSTNLQDFGSILHFGNF